MNAQQSVPQSESGNAPVDESSTAPSESSPTSADSTDRRLSSEGPRPPLPPRPNTLNLLNDEPTPRATLQAEATTAVSRADADTEALETAGSAYSALIARGLSRGLKSKASLSQLASSRGSDAGDSASIRSSIPNGDVGDVEALFKDFVTTAPGGHADAASLLHFPEFAAENVDDDEFLDEFEPVGDLDENAGNEGGPILRGLVFE